MILIIIIVELPKYFRFLECFSPSVNRNLYIYIRLSDIKRTLTFFMVTFHPVQNALHSDK